MDMVNLRYMRDDWTDRPIHQAVGYINLWLDREVWVGGRHLAVINM